MFACRPSVETAWCRGLKKRHATSLSGRLWRPGHCLRAHSDLSVHLQPFLKLVGRDCTAAGQQRGPRLYRRRGTASLRVWSHQTALDHQQDPRAGGRLLCGVVSRSARVRDLQSPFRSAKCCFFTARPRGPLGYQLHKETEREGRVAESPPIMLAKGPRASLAAEQSHGECLGPNG